MTLLNPFCIARRRSSRRLGRLLLLASAAISLIPEIAGAIEKSDQTSLSITQQRELESGISGLVQDVIQENKLTVGNSLTSKPKVSYDLTTKVVTIDLGRGAVPKKYTPDFDEELHLIETNVFETIGKNIKVEAVHFLFGGVDIYYFFPEERGPDQDSSKSSNTAVPTTTASPVVLISAGHGWYKRYPTSATKAYWTYQRPTIAGQVEDLQTPIFASTLFSAMTNRSSDVTKYLARSTSTDPYNDACTGDPLVCPQFNNMAAKYYIKSILPENTEIWNSYSLEDANHPQAHEYDDIRSRPKYANYLLADQMISLHTNAASTAGTPQTTASGTRVFYHEGRATSATLASNISCAMKEIINANAGYSTWGTSSQPSTGYGENRYAQMPAVVVEVGFKDNQTDAAAMLDSTFQTLAAKGIEKGARLTREGKSCVPFTITSIPDVSGPRDGSDIPASINFAGFPQFPVTREISIVSCPNGSTCTDGTQVYSEKVPSPLASVFHCTGSSSETMVYTWSTSLTDADGVKTEPVEHKLTCTPTPSVAGKSNVTAERAPIGADAS